MISQVSPDLLLPSLSNTCTRLHTGDICVVAGGPSPSDMADVTCHLTLIKIKKRK